jgi:hypothetical protein
MLLLAFVTIAPPPSHRRVIGVMNRRTVDSQLAPLVNAAAYDLLAEGRNPTVRAIRERVRASNNDVTAALAEHCGADLGAVVNAQPTAALSPESRAIVRLFEDHLTPAPVCRS